VAPLVPMNPPIRFQNFQKRRSLSISYPYSPCGQEAKALLWCIDHSPPLIWTSLAAEFNTAASSAGLAGLTREFYQLQCHFYSSVSSYITALMHFEDILSSTNNIFLLLNSSRLTYYLPNEYHITVQLLQQSGDQTLNDYITAIRQRESALCVKGNVDTTLNITSESGFALIASSYTIGPNGNYHGRFRGIVCVNYGQNGQFHAAHSGCAGNQFVTRTSSSNNKPSNRPKLICW
jgi:hypothetical protein